MAGVLTLRKIQLGREVTAGTAVAATAVWRGMGSLEDQRETAFADEAIGLMVPTDRAYQPKLLSGMVFEDGPATFEQIFHVLEAGIKTVGTGVADGAGSGKIYNYTFPTTAPNTIKTYTIEGGDNQQAEEMEYAYVDELNLNGAGGEAVMLTANWLGRQSTPTSFTGALTAPTVEEILFSKGKLYINADTSAFGTTIKSSTLLEMSLRIKTGFIPVWTADGALYFTFHKQVRPEVELNITFEHDATGVAEIAAWRARTARAIQLKFEGAALASAGTAYTYKTLIVNLAGKWSEFEKIGEKDGNDIVAGTLRGAYNATLATMGNIIVVNEVASVP